MRLILIDQHSGYIWADTADPACGLVLSGTEEECAIAAAKAVDVMIEGDRGRNYLFKNHPDHASETGYFVYEVPASFPVVEDGRDQEMIDRVDATCSYVGFVSARRVEEP